MGTSLACYHETMIVLIHGDDTAQSRLKLVQHLEEAKSRGAMIKNLAGQKLTPSELETALGSDTLFGQETVLVIEQLLAGVRSKQKTTCIDLIKSASNSVILWENKTLTAAALKQLPTAKIESFPIADTVFRWLDELRGQQTPQQRLKSLHRALQNSEPELCFAMLARQVRLLIQIFTNEPVAGAPFMIAKLRKQAQAFSLPQLLDWHQKMAVIDLNQKQSPRLFDMRQELELFLTKG